MLYQQEYVAGLRPSVVLDTEQLISVSQEIERLTKIQADLLSDAMDKEFLMKIKEGMSSNVANLKKSYSSLSSAQTDTEVAHLDAWVKEKFNNFFGVESGDSGPVFTINIPFLGFGEEYVNDLVRLSRVVEKNGEALFKITTVKYSRRSGEGYSYMFLKVLGENLSTALISYPGGKFASDDTPQPLYRILDKMSFDMRDNR